MAQYEIKPGEVWVRVTVTDGADGSSGGCAACAHVDGEDPRGRYMLDYWTDAEDAEGAGDVICPACYLENSPNATSEVVRDEAIRELARNTIEKEGEIEIDSDALVSDGADNGAYVQAWVWVPFNGTALCKGDDGDHENCEDGCQVLDAAVEAA